MTKRRGLVERLKAVLAGFRRDQVPQGLHGASSRGWWGLMDNSDSIGFQSDARLSEEQQLAFFAVFACITQIAGDIAKLALQFMERKENGIWSAAPAPAAYSHVMQRPNKFQTWQQFMECWLVSKLARGNFAAVKDRDARNVVTGLYPLEWRSVTPLIAPDGSVFYQLRRDELAKLPNDIPAAPASEILHDRATPMFHPLVGTPPLWAAGLAASQGVRIQTNAAEFFRNMSRPSGILVAPSRIDPETAARVKTQWEQNYGPGKIGRTAVLGDGLDYKELAASPESSQLVEQLQLSAKQVCSVFQVPGFMVGIGEARSSDNVQAMVLMYYAQCLQKHIEAAEALIDDALGLDRTRYRVEFNLDDLLRTDSKTLAEVEGLKVQRGIAAPDEARAKFNLAPVRGGAQPYLQQQNYSLEALAKRDSGDDPFGTAKPEPAPAPPDPDEMAEEVAEAAAEGARKAVEPVALAVRDLAEMVRNISAASAEAQRLEAERAEQLRTEEELNRSIADAFERRFATAE